MGGYSHSSSSSSNSTSLRTLVGNCLPLLLTFALCLSIVLVTQNKRRMRRRGRWQPTKRFLPVLVCNWIYGLLVGNRDVDVHKSDHAVPPTVTKKASRQHSQ